MNPKGHITLFILTAVCLTAAAAFGAGCVDDAGIFPEPEQDFPFLSPDETVSGTEDEIEQYIYIFTNEERTAYGLPAVSYDPVLSAAAKAHSADMAANGFFEHTNLKGQGPAARAADAGYEIYKDLGDGWYTEGIGENLFKMPHGNVRGIGYVGKYDAERLAKEIVDGWMESPGHRANILDKGYEKTGIGVRYDGETYYYVTQDFW